ncbi:MAG TPA: serine protease [Xanthobacteraceae bacterium]
MRIVIVAAALALAGPALAQQPAAQPKPQPQASPAASAKPNTPAEAYAATPEAERIALQNDLIWTGDYSGIANPELGPRALAAVKAFQKRGGGKDTGILTPKERVDLATAAKKKREAVGWRVLADAATGAKLGVPGKLVPQAAPVIGGTRWASARGEVQVETFRISAPGTTLQAVHEQQQKAANRKVAYNVLRPDFFVLAGLQGLKKFYVRAQFRDGQVRGFVIQYDQAMAGTVDPVVVGMSSTFTPFPAVGVAAARPARRKVEYGTGVVVSTAGHIVTARELVEGCQVITLAGYGPAERIAEDKATGLALLRIFGARDLKPMPLAETSAEGTVTLVGVADPQAQAGGGAVSTLSGRIGQGSGARAAIEPVPGLGFGGAAAIDGGGKLAGVVDLVSPVVAGGAAVAPQAALIPASAVRGLLTAHGVDSGTAAAGDAKAAVARVICFRK